MAHVTGVILAGGGNSRMAGRNKAFLRIGGKTSLERVAFTLSSCLSGLLVVANNIPAFAGLNLPLVSDVHVLERPNALCGLFTALFYSPGTHAFVSACDAPFLTLNMVELLVSRLAENVDVVLPRTRAGVEPLCAIYSRRCLPVIEHRILKGDLKISRFFSNVRVCEVEEEDLRAVDPELLSFFNINTPEDLERAQSFWPEGRSEP